MSDAFAEPREECPLCDEPGVETDEIRGEEVPDGETWYRCDTDDCPVDAYGAGEMPGES